MIRVDYRGAVIEFDESLEEWVAFWEDDYDTRKELSRNSSLKSIQAFIDKAHHKAFQPIPVLIFDCNDELRNAEITSFTSNPGECWIKYWDGRREKINTLIKCRGSKKIFACGNIINEPMILRILELDKEIKEVERVLQQKQKERIHLKDQLSVFDISGYVTSQE